jgi:hypothetical protein
VKCALIPEKVQHFVIVLLVLSDVLLLESMRIGIPVGYQAAMLRRRRSQ